jgi:hypothetical protein
LEIPVDATIIAENKFLFLKLRLDTDDVIILPIYTRMTNDQRTNFIANKKTDFTKLFMDELEENSTYIPEEAVISENDFKEKYLTISINDRGEKIIIHESDLEYYWYNGIPILNNKVEVSPEKSKTYYFGKGTRSKFKVNLTKLGIKEGDIITITGIEDKTYDNLTVNIKNHEIFEKDGDTIYFNVDALGTYNLNAYSIIADPNQQDIYRRKYLIHHIAPPITHSESDLG